MPLEDLLAKVKDEKREEELRLKREHKNDLENLDSLKREELESLRDELEAELQRKKKMLLSKREREESFGLKMKELGIKKELLEEAKGKVLEELQNLPVEDKKEIYLKSLKEEKELIDEASEIVIPKGKKEKLTPILKEAGIVMSPVEEDLDFKEGFLIRGDRWLLTITLEEILNAEIERDKKSFVNLLFESL